VSVPARAPRVLVVGGGLSGLASAWFTLQALPDADVTVLEREAAPGGCARSDVVDGYLVDRGPNGFLTNVPESYELAQAVGLGDRLTPATDAARQRSLWFRGALRALPTGPGAFLTSELLSPLGKARVALEPFIGRAPAGSDETVHGFATRRLGPEFADAFIAPMVLGITAGDATRTSLRSLFPRLARLEDDHGGLVRGMIARRRAARTDPSEQVGGPSGPGGRLTSFADGGAETLIEGLHRALGDRVRTGAEVVGLEHAEAGGYRVRLAEGEVLDADRVVVATPSFVAAELLQGVAPDAVDDLRAIPYAGVRVLGLGYDRVDVPRPLDGFGFLVPRGHGVRMLGCLWTSTLFPWQAPEGKVLLRVIAGGLPDPEFVDLSDDEALAIVRRDLDRSMGIVAEPEMVHHVRWQRAIPQYWQGHGERVARAMDAARRAGGLHLTGNAYYGVGLNDCVRDARRIADELRAAVAGETPAPA